MRLPKDKIVLGSVILAESAWLYAAFSVVGALAGKETSPLGWLAVFLVLTTAVVVARLIPSDVKAIEALYLGITLLGTLFIYFIVATQVNLSNSTWIDITWILKVMANTEPDPYSFRAFIGMLLGIVLWVRGITIAIATDLSRNLNISFGIGILVIAIALILDSTQGYHLGIPPLVFIFFGSGLAGLSAASLSPSRSEKAKTWPRIIGSMITLLILIGVIFTAISRDILSYITSPITNLLGALFKGVLIIVMAPISLLFSLFYGGVETFFGRDFDPDLSQEIAPGSTPPALELAELPPLELATSTKEETQESLSSGIDLTSIMEWTALVLLVVCSLVVMYIAIRKIAGRQRGTNQPNRESIQSGDDYATDFANLLWKILPDRLMRRTNKRMRPPDGSSGIVEVFNIYYRLLKMSEKKGRSRAGHQTTFEFQNPLSRFIGPELAKLTTYCFDRACYGHHPATDEQLEQLRKTLRKQPASSKRSRT